MVTPDDSARSHAYSQGIEYLQTIQRFALDPAMVFGLEEPYHPAIAAWLGTHHQALNTHLQSLVQSCHNCFHPQARPQVQVFAVPLAAAFGFDGLCNHRTQPTTILLDLGRVIPHHWLRLVAHEYAHAQVGYPGHHDSFRRVLAQLCLGLHLEAPPPNSERWAHWPLCQPTSDPLAFWRGQSVLFVTDH